MKFYCHFLTFCCVPKHVRMNERFLFTPCQILIAIHQVLVEICNGNQRFVNDVGHASGQHKTICRPPKSEADYDDSPKDSHWLVIVVMVVIIFCQNTKGNTPGLLQMQQQQQQQKQFLLHTTHHVFSICFLCFFYHCMLLQPFLPSLCKL